MKGIKFMQALACAALISFLAGVTTLAQTSTTEQTLAKQVRVNQKLRQQNRSLKAENKALALQLRNMNSRLELLEARVSETEFQIRHNNTKITVAASAERDQAVTNWLLLLLGIVSFSVLLCFVWRLYTQNDSLRVRMGNLELYSKENAELHFQELITTFQEMIRRLHTGRAKVNKTLPLDNRPPLRLVKPIIIPVSNTEDCEMDAVELPLGEDVSLKLTHERTSGKLRMIEVLSKAA